ncbi:uncharacterized protein TNCV_4489161 [Trichonephila clavipes]|nr:uncharacterized protein TNCV_4489161 [Trichonephila clavipes]
MNCANTVMINGFELRASNSTALEHRTHCPSTSSELPMRVSAAGGSAIYRNLQSSTNCSEIIVNANKSCGNSVLRKHNVGDICLVDVKVEDLTLFILGAVYIHPKASAEAVKLCLYKSLLPYSANLTKLIPNSQPDLETPIVLCGDFSCDPQQNSYLVEFMRNEFGINYVQTSPTTLGNTTIDCTFTKNINPLSGYLPPEKLFRKSLTLILRFPSKMQQTFSFPPFRTWEVERGQFYDPVGPFVK